MGGRSRWGSRARRGLAKVHGMENGGGGGGSWNGDGNLGEGKDRGDGEEGGSRWRGNGILTGNFGMGKKGNRGTGAGQKIPG